jgi:hypothetical protein
VKAGRIETRAKASSSYLRRAVLCVTVAVPSAVAIAGCALATVVDDLGLVGSGGGREVLGDAGGDASFQLDAIGAETQDAISEADGTGAGAVAVEASGTLEKATPVECAGISVFSVNPAALPPGQQSQLTVVTVGPPALVQWTVSPPSGGKVSSPTALTPTFECADTEPVTVAVTVAPAEGGTCAGVLFSTYSASIDCQK